MNYTALILAILGAISGPTGIIALILHVRSANPHPSAPPAPPAAPPTGSPQYPH